MLAIVSLLVVLALSVLVVRIGTVALTMTGLSSELAAFQALSAFSGAGFTTAESEKVIATAARRKVVTLLIRLGSLGVVTSVSSLVLSFVETDTALGVRLVVLLAGLAVLLFLTRNPTFNRLLTGLIRRALRRTTTLDLHDYAHLLHLRQDYRVAQVAVHADSWLASRPLRELYLTEEGVVALAVTRQDGSYLGAPGAELLLRAGDSILLYGHRDRLEELSQRSGGDEGAHQQARKDHAEKVAQQAG